MNNNEIAEAVNILENYCDKIDECVDCIFHYKDSTCGIHNPTLWRGVNKGDE